VDGALSSQNVKATNPPGAPLVEFPVTVAQSFQEFPTVEEPGLVIVVVKAVGVTVTLKHSVSVRSLTAE
jgi:hypothetical protein